MKVCTICKKEHDLTHYYKSKTTPDGLDYRCKTCHNQQRRDRNAANPEKYYIKRREQALKHHYGITLYEYKKMFEGQGKVCACCGTSDTSVPTTSVFGVTDLSFVVDHCHTTGVIRGLLCTNCNRGIGLLGDTKESLQKALNYLDTH